MARKQSEFMCQRCGLAVYLWYGHGKKGEAIWKHAAGSNSKSCGKPADVVKRADFDKSIQGMLDAQRDFAERMKKNAKTTD